MLTDVLFAKVRNPLPFMQQNLQNINIKVANKLIKSAITPFNKHPLNIRLVVKEPTNPRGLQRIQSNVSVTNSKLLPRLNAG